NDINCELRPDVGGFGKFYDYEYCPEHSWAFGFVQRVEPYKLFRDNTALNAIRLYCRKKNGVFAGYISSYDGVWGNWGEVVYCDDTNSGFLFNAVFKIKDYQGGIVDDTSANDFKSQCWNGTTVSYMDLHAKNGGSQGEWKNGDSCNEGSAICGISSKFESPQGNNHDDTAMNGAFFKCCSL
ncbi:unnamed protein product, partial [Rotaria sp. Silwood2]